MEVNDSLYFAYKLIDKANKELNRYGVSLEEGIKYSLDDKIRNRYNKNSNFKLEEADVFEIFVETFKESMSTNAFIQYPTPKDFEVWSKYAEGIAYTYYREWKIKKLRSADIQKDLKLLAFKNFNKFLDHRSFEFEFDYRDLSFSVRNAKENSDEIKKLIKSHEFDLKSNYAKNITYMSGVEFDDVKNLITFTVNGKVKVIGSNINNKVREELQKKVSRIDVNDFKIKKEKVPPRLETLFRNAKHIQNKSNIHLNKDFGFEINWEGKVFLISYNGVVNKNLGIVVFKRTSDLSTDELYLQKLFNKTTFGLDKQQAKELASIMILANDLRKGLFN